MTKKSHITLEGRDASVSRVEDLLPQLATRADIEAAFAPVATSREMRILHAELKRELQKVAASLLSLHAKFDARF